MNKTGWMFLALALTALRQQTPGSLIVVLGAGGDRDRGKRAAMGAAAASHADLVIVTDNGTEVFTWPDGGQTPFAGGKGTAQEKMDALRAAGVHVAVSPAEIGSTLKAALKQ